MAFHLKILKTFFTLECFDRNWPSDSGEEDENAKSFRTEYKIRKGLLSFQLKGALKTSYKFLE